ncbi:histidine phosphatase family protein [Nocardioides perillae]|uniref:Broad specificity phosphatase PhoE n=1 Tax=Nocardioides perillae TaxID=1119534 RepID=A0A7Y9RQU9_9ACTN|nr:broad specificity phosphatase PhoE [Nocardioides perillae]
MRHGESAANLADAAARAAGAEALDLADRDADVALSETGRAQAEALGRWLLDTDEARRPTVVVSSPYRRARDTAAGAADPLGLDIELDERLRERDLGLLDGLTPEGVRSRLPSEAERRARLGKFWYVPPSGESWADVAQRLRGLLADLRHGFDGERVWLFTHQAVVMTFRYVLEDVEESALLDLDRQVRIPNASVTTYRREGRFLEPVAFADTTAVQAHTEVTREAPADGTRAPEDGGSRGRE